MIGHGAVLNDTGVKTGGLATVNTTFSIDVNAGEWSIVAAGTVIPEGSERPPESFWRGVPARIPPLTGTTVDLTETFRNYSSGTYSDLAERHSDAFE